MSGSGRLEQVSNPPSSRDHAAELPAGFYERLLQACPELICVWDIAAQRIVFCNAAAEPMLGVTPAQLEGGTGETVERLLGEPQRIALASAIDQISEMADGESVRLRIPVRAADGTRRWLASRLSPFARDESGAVTQCLAVADDVTHDVEAEHLLSYRTLHDALTGLANRTLIRDRLQASLHRATRGGSVGVLFCDLDGFKGINDQLGHRAGDQVLLAVADRIQRSVRESDTVGRLGGDEFVVVTDGDGDLRSVAEAIKQRIQRELTEPIQLESGTCTVSASIGIGIAGADGDADLLLEAADAAMYAEKRHHSRIIELGSIA